MKKDGNTKQLTVLVDIDELKEFQSACRTQDMNLHHQNKPYCDRDIH